MDELKVKQKDSCNPPVDSIIGVQGRVLDHSFYKLRIHLNNQLFDAYSVQLGVLQGPEETMQLKFHLRIPRLAIIEGNRAEPAGVTFPILAKL